MFKNFLNKLAGSPYEREIARYREIVSQINEFEVELLRELGLEGQSDPVVTPAIRERLQALTGSFQEAVRERLDGIEDNEERLTAERQILDELLPQAFAAVRVASTLTIGLRHFDVQLIGGIVLYEGKIAEMKTGEGKTLVATLPLYLNALTGRGVHLVTVNDYLARRDGGWMGPIYHLLGLSTSVIGKESYSAIFDPDYVDPGGELEDERLVHWRPVPRRECYRADITYGTASEFGFDYLRDNTAVEFTRVVQRGHPFAIVDEVDSVLIDSARTPLIISGPAAEAASTYRRFAEVIENARLRRNTSDLENDEPPNGDYVLDDRTQSISLTELGIEKVERLLPEINREAGQSIYDPEFYDLVHYLENALKAKYVFHRDKEYIVQNGHVILIDQTTGRPMPSRRYSEGLHQAIEAKEGVQVQRENVTIATITVQNYFRMYDKLSGMTGTALTQAEEFDEVYTLDVVAIPTNVEYQAESGEFEVRRDREEGVPVITYWDESISSNGPLFYKRIDYPDQVFQSIEGKFTAVAQEIAELAQSGRPVLVGTGSVEASEVLSRKLKKIGMPHEVLNAKNHQREALIIAQAGRPGAITISTSMAGRGTDILLGGNPEGLASKLVNDRTFTFNALHSVVTEVVAGDVEAARRRAQSERYMDDAVVDWAVRANEDLVKKAQVEDIMTQVAHDIREDAAYSHIAFDTLIQVLQQLNLALIDQRRIEKAQQIAEQADLPPSLIPELEFRLNQYRSLQGLLGQSGHADTLTQMLMERHYNARAALIRAVLNDDLEEAHRITTQVPGLPASLIDDIEDLRRDCAEARQAVWALGGLHVIGTERHEARRIDDQLRGRAARQGDPGSSRFYLSLEDELMMRFGGERTKALMGRLNIPEDMPISANILSNAIETAQGRFEAYNFDIRKNLIEYDEAVNRQRQIVYDERQSILAGDDVDLDGMVNRFISESLEATITRLRDNYEPWAMEEIESVQTDFSNLETGEVNTRGVISRVRSLFPPLTEEELQDLYAITDGEELTQTLHEMVLDAIDAGYHLRMLQAEINRIVPLWPVLPPLGPRGIEGWDRFVENALSLFDRYASAMPGDNARPTREEIAHGLEEVFRESLTWGSRGLKPNEMQALLSRRTGQVLERGIILVIDQLHTEELLAILSERVEELLAFARQEPVQGTNGADLPLERLVYSIGAEQLANYQRALMLSVIDREWRQYLEAIDELRQGIGLEAFGQRDPKVQFKRRAFEMFDKLRADVEAGIARRFFSEIPYHRQVIEAQQRQEALLDRLAQQGYRVQQRVQRSRDGEVKVAQTVQKDVWSNVGRNDPCPCGSGKKFKDCHYPIIRTQMQTSTQKPVTQQPGGGGKRRRRRR